MTSIEQIHSNAQIVSSEIGTSAYADIFEKEHNEFERSARKWFWGVWGLAAAGILALGAYIYYDPMSDAGAIGIIRWTSIKVLLASAFFVFLTFAVRNYNAARHNATVNRHRANAMRTFELFTEAAKTEDTKDAVLRQATEAIFGMQSSGFIHRDGAGTAPQQVTEIITRAIGKQD